ncbi:MAG: site-specific DNA-methyltransferase [Akkermansiaceae bacterium]|nr:site-specific DNA-methyltransferase [Akkermansiaceae bacterium]MCP5547213.1 site-specific DNA-methyltransferase [Akkermansiaceae bacterium]
MPTLNWIGKDAVVKHHKEVPFRLLEADKKLSFGDPAAGNLIVEGDNLHALKALLPRYAGKVKCICIDPPYNTGNEGWVYNDNVNSPEILRWLGQTVGKEAEDLSRHDKWLCMMYPRLVLLKRFLSDDGLILVCMDENEIGNVRLLMDEIFGRFNCLGTIVWNTRNTDNRVKTYFSHDHEYILIYGGGPGASLEGRVIDRGNFRNTDNDKRGPYVTDPLTGKATADERPNLHAYSMRQPGTRNVWDPDPAKGWITDEAGYEKLLAEKRIWWPPNPSSGKPRKKRFLYETSTRMPAGSFWAEFRSQSGAKELDDILGQRLFAFPKPTAVMQRIIDHCVPPEGIVLDSFAGSGTTAHAVLKQNAADGGNRKFILVEMLPEIARGITAERVRRVAGGYTNAKGEKVEGLGGGFQYCRLSKEPLFDATGAVREDVRFAELAEFVWFAETGTGFSGRAKSPLLGIHDGVAVYLLYNGILKDRTVDGGNVLTAPVLAMLPPHDGPKVIYAAANRLGAPRLQREQIVFKQTPYALDL